MRLANTELEYLRTSLTSDPVLRPDSRHVDQFRPVKSQIDILPMANGSSRVTASDGSDCIVGVKVKVVPQHTDLVDVSVDIAGVKDNDPFPRSLAVVLKQVIDSCPEITEKTLILNPKYAFKLYIDCVALSYTSHPLLILSIAIFQALKSTKLPLKLTAFNDDQEGLKSADEVEIPQFDEDWTESVNLCPSNWTPPLLFIVAIVGKTVIIDPTLSEEQVAEASMFLTWKNGQVCAPIRTLDLGSAPFVGTFDPQTVFKAYEIVEQCAPKLEQYLMN